MNKRYTSALLSKGDSPSALPLSEEIIGEEIASGDISSSLSEDTIIASPIEEQTIQTEEITTPSLLGVLGTELDNFLASDINEIAPRIFELTSSEDLIVTNEIKANVIEGFISANGFSGGGEGHNTNTRYKIVQDNENPFSFSLYSREIDSSLWVLVSTITLPIVTQINHQSTINDGSAATVRAIKDYVEERRTLRRYPSVSEFPTAGDIDCVYLDTSTSISYYYDSNLGAYKKVTIDPSELDIDWINANFN